MTRKSSLYGTTAAVLVLSWATAMSASAQAQDGQSLETIVVLGVRGSQQKAVDLKQKATTIQDSIVAEDIGKLPDTTISDSLQRIPGVQIRRAAGEGSSVNIRGLPQVVTLLNGEEYLGANSITTVQPNFGDIPSQLFAGANVIKSPTANMMLGGITGTIDLKTRRPFDLDQGFTATLAAEGAWGNRTHTWQPQVNGLVGYNQGRFGLLVSGAYSNVTEANYYNGIEQDVGWSGYKYDTYGAGDPTPMTASDGKGIRYFSYQGHIAYQKMTERKRAGLNISGQADLGDGFVLTADGFYTNQIEYNRGVGFADESKWQTWNGFAAVKSTDTGALDVDGNHIYTVQDYELHTIRMKSSTQMARFDSRSANFNLELNYDNGGPFTGSVRVTYAKASQYNANTYADIDMANGSQWGISPSYYPTGWASPNPGGYAAIPVINVAYGDTQTWSNVPAFVTNEASYGIGAISSENNYDRYANMRAIRASGKYTFSERFNIEAGVRISGRGARNDQYNLFAPLYAGNGASSSSGCLVKWKATDVVLNGGGDPTECWAGSASTYAANSAASPNTFYTALKPTPLSSFGNDAIFVKDFGSVQGLPGVWAINPKAMDNPLAFNNKLFPGNVKVADPGASYAVNISQQMGFAQFNVDGSAGVPWHVNAGVRVISTDLDITQHTVGKVVDGVLKTTLPYSGVAVDGGTTKATRSFVDILPSVNLSFDMRDDLKFRFGYAKTMTMLDLQRWGGALTPTYTIDSHAGSPTQGKFIVAGGSANGNPKLDPWRADAFNASAEWYLSEGSLINVDLFLYKIDSFIQNGVVQMALPDADGVVRRTVAVNTSEQKQGGTVNGVEIGWKQQLDFLPGLWKGLGLDVNYTYSPSDSGYKDVQNVNVPLQDNSTHSANAILWYQLEGLQARVAYNFRSKRASTQNDIWGKTSGMTVYQKPMSYVDLSLSYDIFSNLTAYAQASNITGEKEKYYYQWESQYAYENGYERRITIGLRGRL
jgi:TonB-dependent receptor